MNILEQAFQLFKKEQKKQKIYWDVDDVILATTEAMVELINKKYRIPNNLEPRSREQCKDWEFKGLYRGLTKEQQMQLFESDEFWDTVVIKPEFYNIVNSDILGKYENIFITKGSEYNLLKKKDYLYNKVDIKNVFRNFEYIGISNNESKSKIDMTGGIQIDDNYSNLKTTKAKLKILIKNDVESVINNSYGMIDTLDNLYNVNSLNDILEILKFNLIEAL